MYPTTVEFTAKISSTGSLCIKDLHGKWISLDDPLPYKQKTDIIELLCVIDRQKENIQKVIDLVNRVINRV